MVSLCIKDNNEKFQNYLMQKIGESNIPDIYYSKHIFKIYENVIIHYKGKNLKRFYNYLSNVLSDSIINYYEPIIVKRLILKDYFYFDAIDRNSIYNEFNLLKHNSRKYIKQDILDYIENNRNIVIEGFVNFRLNKLKTSLEPLVESAVSKFVLDKEYIEFVSLLKGYVDNKIPEPIKIHLIYSNKESILLDENYNVLELENFDSEYLSDISFSQNDYALNTLIGKLPQEIYIHLISPKDEYIETLELIFGNKIHICTGCAICSAYKLLNLK